VAAVFFSKKRGRCLLVLAETNERLRGEDRDECGGRWRRKRGSAAG